jgi:glutaredoxin 3
LKSVKPSKRKQQKGKSIPTNASIDAVTIYTTPGCEWCQRTRQFLHQYNIRFAEKNVAEDLLARKEMMKKSGQTGVPVIVVNEEIIIGFDEKELKEKLGIG